MPSVLEVFDSMDYGPAPEDAGRVRDWLSAHANGFGLFIGGEWRAATSGASLDSHDPATGERLASVAVAGSADVDAAVAAAGKAFPAWSGLGGHHRARHLYALARAIQKHSRFLAVLEALDNGKPIRETRDLDIPLAARHFYHHAGWAQLMDSEFEGFAPLGVAGQVIPWNFPLLMLAWKIAPAIAAGNTVVLKPAEFTSLSALRFAELCVEAGLPAGVVNIVTGAGETGSLLVRHPDVAKVAFTGSTDVGRLIREQTAGTGKALSLELGGKSPFIVFEDADLDGAVEGLVDAIWLNQGEVCCAGSRLLLEESIAPRFIERIKTRLAAFRIGDPLDKAVDMGAIVDPVQKARIERLVAQSVDEGATLWQPDIACPADGCFYPPTLLTDVAPANVAAREEIFGPVLAATTFRTLEEAVALADNTIYGLAASIWSENVNRALEVAAAVKAGVVWINGSNQFDAACGFGGYRQSGFGREGGREGMFEYLHPAHEWAASGDDSIAAPAASRAAGAVPEAIDRTPKHYIGGKQKRADNGSSRAIVDHKGRLAGMVADGSRKDIRDAVEAAHAAASWATTTGHGRAQILYYLAENMSQRAAEFAAGLVRLTGVKGRAADVEVDASISRLFTYAAWADKHDGAVHSPPGRMVTLAMNEPLGVIGVACPDRFPLLGLVSLVAPVIAAGNRCVAVPSERYPLPAIGFYQLLETSDVPAGVVNIVTGERDMLALVLALHDQVDGIWYFGSADGSAMVEKASAGNLKRTWVNNGRARDWLAGRTGEGRQYLRHATQVKNIWLPYGD